MNIISDQVHEIQEEEDRSDILKIFLYLIIKWDRNYYVNRKLKKLSEMNIENILNEKFARKLFKKYLKLPLANSPENLHIVKRYNICNKLISDNSLMSNNDIINMLYTLCPSENWETRIWSELRQYRLYDRQFGIILLLNQLKEDCMFDLLTSVSYHQFKAEINRGTTQMRNLIKSIYNQFYVE